MYILPHKILNKILKSMHNQTANEITVIFTGGFVNSELAKLITI